jgi:hypothetical protein
MLAACLRAKCDAGPPGLVGPDAGNQLGVEHAAALRGIAVEELHEEAGLAGGDMTLQISLVALLLIIIIVILLAD